jgi:hypothetical protein
MYFNELGSFAHHGSFMMFFNELGSFAHGSYLMYFNELGSLLKVHRYYTLFLGAKKEGGAKGT